MMRNLFSTKLSVLTVTGLLLSGAFANAQSFEKQLTTELGKSYQHQLINQNGLNWNEGVNEACSLSFPFSLANGIGDLSVISLADDFKINESESLSLNKVSFSLINNIEEASIIIYHDNNGAPGTVFTTINNLVPTSQTIIGSNYDMNFYNVVFDLPSTVELTEGTYWLGINAT